MFLWRQRSHRPRRQLRGLHRHPCSRGLGSLAAPPAGLAALLLRPRSREPCRTLAGTVKSARRSIVLIDNYVDETVLLMLSKRSVGVSATIYTQRITQQLQLDLDRHNSQYTPIDIRTYRDSHDRFLIVDETDVYHIGASLKDLGKKMFAFSKLDIPAAVITDLL